MKMKKLNLKKRLLPLAMTATVLLAGAPASALELTIDGESSPASMIAGIPVVLEATASIGAIETEFFVDGVSIGKGTETANESGVFTLTYTPTQSGSHRISAVERMAQGGIGKADEVRVYTQTLVQNILETDFNGKTAGAVAESTNLWGWNIPAVATVDDAHGVSMYPTSQTEWNVKNISKNKNCDFVAELDYYIPTGGVLQGKIVAEGGSSDQDVYITPTSVETCVYDASKSDQRGWLNSRYAAGTGWHHLKVVTHMADLTKSIYVDGNLIFDRVNVNQNAINAINNNGKYIQRFGVISSGNTYVDNVKLRLVQPVTEVTDISYQDGSFSVTLTGTADAATAASAIRLLRVGDSEGESAPISVTATGKTLIVTPIIPLQQSSTYRLVIDQSLMAGNKALDRDYLYSIDTPAGGDAVLDGKFHQGRIELNAAAGLKAGDEVSFSGKLVHAQDTDVWVAIAAYQKQADGTAEMVGCEMKELSLTASEGDSLIATLTLTEDLAEGAYLKAYVWKKSGLQPYSNAFSLDN